MIFPSREVVMERTILKSIAHPKPFTTKPSNKELAISIMIASMMKMKSPKVSKVMGAERNTIMGFTKVFSNPRMMDRMMAVR